MFKTYTDTAIYGVSIGTLMAKSQNGIIFHWANTMLRPKGYVVSLVALPTNNNDLGWNSRISKEVHSLDLPTIHQTWHRAETETSRVFSLLALLWSLK